MGEKEKKNDELEFNDGLGDMLRDKETHEFSWAKTGAVIGAIIVVVVLAFIISFNIGKNVITSKAKSVPTSSENGQKEISKEEVQATGSEAEQTDQQLLAKIEKNINEKKTEAPELKSPEVKPVVETPKASPVTKQLPAPKKTKIQKSVHNKPKLKSTKTASSGNFGIFPFKVIAGSYTSKSNAKQFSATLKKKGVDTYIKDVKVNGKIWYRVQVGAFKTHAQAAGFEKRLKRKGITTFIGG